MLSSNDTISAGLMNNEGIITFNFFSYDTDKFFALVEDIDGEENQGEFISQVVNLTEADTTVVKMKK